MPEKVWLMRGSATKEQNSEDPFQPKFMASANRHVSSSNYIINNVCFISKTRQHHGISFQHDNQYQNQLQSKETNAGNLNGPERE